MLRDIDHAAAAVKAAIVEKFGHKASLDELQVVANERTICVRHGQHEAEGTRDDLLIALRKAPSYEKFWQMFAAGSES